METPLTPTLELQGSSRPEEIWLDAANRRDALVDQARRTGRVEVAESAQRFGVTQETIRRDLVLLQRQGQLQRVHGGAVPVDRLSAELQLAARAQIMRAEKDRIAKAAAAEIPQDGSVVIESGSTTAALCDLIPAQARLVAVTNSLPIALKLVALPGLTVLTVGGRVREQTLAEADEWAIDRLRELHADVAFLGTNGLSPRRGLSTPDPAEAAVKKAMLNSASRRILLADHTKIGNECLCCYGSLADIDVLITDSGTAPELRDALAEEIPDIRFV